ncbi:50S ribosomal protein L25, partial [Candidatus Peregrinibacteria bacterium CG10_big_fil_rev_8_21_14_0_10_54_7]
MDMIPLKVSARDNAFKAKVLRKSNQVPCVVYGNEVKNMSLQCGYNDLFRVYLKAGESTLVDLDFGGKNVPVLFHAVQFDPISDRITHVDFYAVDMKKEIEASVPVH